MEKTKIEWADATWNPVTGCNHNCEYCYARNIAKRFGGWTWVVDNEMDNLHDTVMKSESSIRELNEPLEIIAESGKARKAPYPYDFIPTLHRYRLGDYHNKKAKNIFVCSMADLFGDWVPDKWIEEVFEACDKAPQHRYMFLTKNPTRYVKLLLNGKLLEKDNMWYGISVTNKQQALRAEIELSDMSPIAGAFVSIEPLLEDISEELSNYMGDFVDWVIIGAETGNRKERVIPKAEWIHKIVNIARKNNVPVFMKDSLIPIIGEDQMLREFPW